MLLGSSHQGGEDGTCV